ncbi:hypothetical protein D3C76_1637390 [compost metagenome]
MRLPTPHTSPTSVFLSTQSRFAGSHIFTTPPVWDCNLFAVWLASLAKVLVGAMPTPTGIPVHRNTRLRIFRPSASSPSIPVKSAKASSMLYTSTAGTIDSISVMTRSLISPYSA